MNSTPQPIGVKEYRHLLEKLLAQGTGFARKEEIVVIPSGDSDKVYLTHDIQKGLELLQRGEKPRKGDLTFKTRSKSIIDSLYEPAEPSDPGNGRWKVKPSQSPVVLRVNEETVIPVLWTGTGFTIPAGGYLMVKQQYVEALSKALDGIRKGTTTEADALLVDTTTDGKVAKFDVYGYADHDLAADGYLPVELEAGTKAITARIAAIFNAEAQAAEAKAATAAAYAALPFTRKSSNFVADHIAPERASFRKRTKSQTPV